MHGEIMKIGVIGAGNMGGAMIKGWLNAGVKPQDIIVKGGSSPQTETLQKELHFTIIDDYKDLSTCNLIILATPSKIITKVLEEVYLAIEDETIPIISIAAGIIMKELESVTSKTYPLSISIPNLAVQVNEGILATVFSPATTSEQKDTILNALSMLGKVVITGEEGLDFIMTITGCGPAIVAEFIEGISDSAVKYGLPRSMSYDLIAQMLIGTSALVLEERIHPAILKDGVTSPSGVTIKGVLKLQEEGFQGAIHKAIRAIMKD